MALPIKTPNALKEDLREQTIIIEDCTAELKALLGKRVYDGTIYDNYVKEADKLIDDALKELRDENLKEMALSRLKLFARKEFKRLRAVLYTITGFSFAALACVLKIQNSDTIQDKEKAFAKLQTLEPSLADVEPNFQVGTFRATKWAQPLNEYMHNYMQKVNETASYLAKDRAKDKDGLSLRLSSELYVRNQWQEANLKSLRESGDTLVWISSHSNCSERCQRYQGRLYSLNHTKGRTKDGHDYVPLEEATDHPYTTRTGKTWNNGCLTGFGCRHYTIKYKENGETPLTFDAKEVERARKLETEQRKLERDVFKAREEYYSFRGKNKDKARYYRAQAMQLRDKYIEFCHSHNMAYYPDRIQVKPQ